ncbi:MAG TPA: hypothetical protein VD839_00665 [Burkholderiales bacterium]|jgi:hypothetical protein|nr:hypothetical protein [Burkholderiales bacterium]
MAIKVTTGKLALLAATTAMAGAIHSGAQAEQRIDCNSGLAQIAIASQQGSEGGVWESYAHCMTGAQRSTPQVVAGPPERKSNPRLEALTQPAWPDQSYIQD